MSDKIFDLEQQLLDCWGVTEDISMVNNWFMDDPQWEGMDSKLQDAMMNKFSAIQELYELKFNRVWNTFEEVCKEYHTYRKGVKLNDGKDVNFDDE